MRRAAIATLTETVPAGTATALVAALADPHGTVRAAAGLRELVEVLPATAGLAGGLARLAGSPDAVVRATALDVRKAAVLALSGWAQPTPTPTSAPTPAARWRSDRGSGHLCHAEIPIEESFIAR
ncbi:hypothetical protein Sme01_48990 [Sphaerisporangium melleum]|uniref:Uncharacterized protein n=1 Tax=Sphaerisporangium melleum TaxID=321316 RepID=A0A917R398_9ACTN|nr:hypothetical protein [Sphaerisporangium melleum]GGK87576.1 hypothetical protein GCM10007964_32680 [Sphaerisporangium melleum]GII72423.1 hypothetical protein Sme01_48990 [Sphaerisporangium melleum]